MDDQPAQSTNLRTLKNGAVYDMDAHRIVSSKNVTTKITVANAVNMQSQRIQRKRDVIQAAANAAVQRDDYRTGFGDEAYIAAIAETAMIKATTPDDPKAIEAARFILDNTGVSEARAQASQDSSVPGSIAGELLALLRDTLTQRGVIVDADSIDA